MLISIVVPVYKVEQCLERCVDSLINQTYKDLEIILVDDGSPDSCGLICDTYQAKDDRVIVIHKANGGLSDARNAGLKKSSGDYVFFVDSDDYIKEDACEKMLPFLENSRADIVMGDCDVTEEGYECYHYADLEVGKKFSGSQYMKAALQKKTFPVVVWLNAYRRQFLLDNGLYFKENILHEDVEFSPRAFICAKSVVYTGVSFYHYVINDTSITSQKDKRKHCKDIYETGLSICELAKKTCDNKLCRLLENYLAGCYMGVFRSGKLYKYGSEFVHKKYALKYAHSFENKVKAFIFSISPKLFCML